MSIYRRFDAARSSYMVFMRFSILRISFERGSIVGIRNDDVTGKA